MSGTAIKVPTEFRAVDKFTSVVKKMTAGVSRFSKSGISAIKRFDSQIDKTLNSMGKIQQLALGLGVGALFTAAIQNNIAYNDSLASVKAITGSTADEMVLLEQLSQKTAKSTKMLGADVNKAYELIGSAQPKLLKNHKALDEVTNSTILMAKAARLELEPAAKALTDVMNQFDISDSVKVIDTLAAGAKEGAAAIPLINDAILAFGPTAKGFNVSLGESVSLIEVFAGKGLKGAEAGTKLRNILTKMSTIKALPKEAIKQLEKFGVNSDIVSDSTIPLIKRLKELRKISGDATAMVKVFGAENKDAGSILLGNLSTYDDLTKKMDQSGLAASQAATNSNTFKGALNAIKNSFLNATTATNSNNSSLNFLKDILFSVGNNMESIVVVVGAFIIAWGIMKAVVWSSKAAMFAYNVVLGVNTMLTQKNKRAIIGNTIATNAYKVAMGISTAMTWLANTAFGTLAVSILAATWPILAIIAAITALVYVFLYWDEIVSFVKKSFLKSVMAISSAWGRLVNWFKEFSFEDFFKQIGQSIINFLLSPLKTALWLVSKMPGKLGKIGADALAKVNDVTGSILVSPEEKLDAPETKQADLVRENNTNFKGSVDLNIKDKGGNVESASSNSPDFPINVTPTVGAF
ncbi:phage tail tape measure protein [Tenacibaculum finnmarkense]|uniref:phage tail tape measure protein n=1 Tax=Tenacibaculum finnmarkense TaxID=2781243 RepID=UPI00207A9C3C|nr:phage tail tape measure protein [Tenacibaculum finnmarkense]MCM8906777.1 phage tail tape measure protein [Tenacibaculum finnmarkense genomovar finnmarkense]